MSTKWLGQPWIKAQIDQAGKILDEQTAQQIETQIVSLVKKHDERALNSINLDAGSGQASPAAMWALTSDLSNRVLAGQPHQHIGSYGDEIEALAIELAKALFRADYVEHRALAAAEANGIVICGLTEPGDHVMALHPVAGHASYYGKFGDKAGYLAIRGSKVHDVPFNFDYDMYNIDLDAYSEVISSTKPRLIIIGSQKFLFPYPLKEMREIAGTSTKILYDGAHVLGLIAGRRFQDPLHEGANILVGSGYKTLCGPFGKALILSNDAQIAEKISSSVHGGIWVANYGAGVVASLAITLAEMLEFGASFADQIVRNAKSLGGALDKEGFTVVGKKRGYTESHTLILDVSEFGGGDRMVRSLEAAGIIATSTDLRPADPHSGIRLGVTSATRFGMKEKEMVDIARFVRRVAIDGERPEKVAEDVRLYRQDYQAIHYCFRS